MHSDMLTRYRDDISLMILKLLHDDYYRSFNDDNHADLGKMSFSDYSDESTVLNSPASAQGRRLTISRMHFGHIN